MCYSNLEALKKIQHVHWRLQQTKKPVDLKWIERAREEVDHIIRTEHEEETNEK